MCSICDGTNIWQIQQKANSNNANVPRTTQNTSQILMQQQANQEKNERILQRKFMPLQNLKEKYR